MRIPGSGLRLDSPSWPLLQAGVKLCECGCGQEVNNRFRRGHQPIWNMGLTKAIDRRVALYASKISVALRGRVRPKEAVAKTAQANKGKKRSKEARENISRGHLGQSAWHKGLKGCFSQSALSKMAIAKRGNTCHKAIPQTEKMKREHAERMRKLWAEKNSIYNSPNFLQKRAKAQAVLPNKPEVLLIALIQQGQLPFKYVGDGEVIIGRKCPDFININGKKQVIELYGDYWHKNQDPQARINLFAQYGFSTLIIWEHEMREPEKVLVKLKEFMGENPE